MQSSSDSSRLVAHVRGHVQGVGYRFYTRRQARILGLRGAVRNDSDGSVEVIAEGPRHLLEQLLGALRRGPAGASIERVDVAWEAASGQYTEFRVEH